MLMFLLHQPLVVLFPASLLQVQNQVTKLQTRLDSNLLKRLDELDSTSGDLDLTADHSGLQTLQQTFDRAAATLKDIESRLGTVEAKSEELQRKVCMSCHAVLDCSHIMAAVQSSAMCCCDKSANSIIALRTLCSRVINNVCRGSGREWYQG